MNIEEIRKNAPEGTTHYFDYDGLVYYKYDGYGGLQAHGKNGWAYCHDPQERFNMERYSDLIKPLN